MFHDQRTEADAKRTITLSEKDLSAARRLLKLLLGIEPKSFAELLKPLPRGPADLRRGELIVLARAEFENRRRRAAAFGQSMFGEPAWDMLLVLYIVDMSGQRQTMGSLFQLSGHPASTAKRWLDYLEAHRLVQMERHPTDRRTAFVSLTGEARRSLDLYFSETVETGV
jgi:DNA-binding MarR family transcriptional regulator